MIESDILYTAIENLEKLTQAQIEVDAPLNPNGHDWEAQLYIRVGANKSSFKVEVKENVLPSGLLRWVDKLNEAQTLLVAKYISNPAKELLEKRGINYLDTSGNCYIRNDSGIFWHFKGQSEMVKNGEIKHRAFQKNGIKLIYALLLNEELLNKRYREIASIAKISVSTVGDILTDLQAAKFLVKVNEKKMALINKPELLGEWVTAFNQKLKPKLVRGKFLLLNPNWQKIEIGNLSYWGGEPAADLLTANLYPGAWTLYSNLDRKSLIKEFQLIPSEETGNVTICSLFWSVENEDFVLPALKTVHPLLVYADLIGSGNDRNFEIAKKIYERYLKSFID
ncbi:MAG: type IV toxin-antitoxin system AbiEi family antitoxin [Bdellovibrionales bacterium]